MPEPANINTIGKTLDLTALLNHAGSANVTNEPRLNFTFIDREIVPARTTGNAHFENGERATHVRRLDWLLANTRDRLPIIAEVKVGSDKDPFYALIQLLMYAAELVTGPQLARLQRHYPNCFNIPKSGPVMDLYIVVCKVNPRSQERADILAMTDELIRKLVAWEGISDYIRRIACLDVRLGDNRNLHFTRLFSYP